MKTLLTLLCLIFSIFAHAETPESPEIRCPVKAGAFGEGARIKIRFLYDAQKVAHMPHVCAETNKPIAIHYKGHNQLFMDRNVNGKKDADEPWIPKEASEFTCNVKFGNKIIPHTFSFEFTTESEAYISSSTSLEVSLKNTVINFYDGNLNNRYDDREDYLIVSDHPTAILPFSPYVRVGKQTYEYTIHHDTAEIAFRPIKQTEQVAVTFKLHNPNLDADLIVSSDRYGSYPVKMDSPIYLERGNYAISNAVIYYKTNDYVNRKGYMSQHCPFLKVDSAQTIWLDADTRFECTVVKRGPDEYAVNAPRISTGSGIVFSPSFCGGSMVEGATYYPVIELVSEKSHQHIANLTPG